MSLPRNTDLVTSAVIENIADTRYPIGYICEWYGVIPAGWREVPREYDLEFKKNNNLHHIAHLENKCKCCMYRPRNPRQ